MKIASKSGHEGRKTASEGRWAASLLQGERIDE
jgi:hypothetical protein